MESLLGLMRDYGLGVCAAAVLLGALVTARLTRLAHRLVHTMRVRRWTRRHVTAWGIPPTSACVPAYDRCAVVLLGVQEADFGVRVGEDRLEVLEPMVLGSAPQIGDQVLLMGRLHHVASEQPRSYRESSDGVWTLAGIDGPVQCATMPRFAGTRRGVYGAALVGAMATFALVDSLGARALRRFEPPTRSYTFVSTREERWRLDWTRPNALRALVALCSPRHRATIRPHLGPRVGTQAVSIDDEIQIIRVVEDGLRPAGRKTEAARLLFAAGFRGRALEVLRGADDCHDQASCDFLRELFVSDRLRSPYSPDQDAPYGVRRDLSERLLRGGTFSHEAGDVYLLAGLAYASAIAERPSPDPPPRELLQGVQDWPRYRGPLREALQCVGEVSIPGTEPSRARTDAMLRSPSPACRILAATLPSRLDDASLHALHEISRTSPSRWRPLLDAARDLIVLEGTVTGRLLRPPPCAAQVPHGVHTPAAYAQMPEVALRLFDAVRASRCAWMAEAIGLPVLEGILRFALDTFGESPSRRYVFWRSPVSTIGAQWFGRALQRYEGVLAGRRNAARFDPRFDDAYEGAVQEGLRRVRQTGVMLMARTLQFIFLAPRPSATTPIETPRMGLTRTLMVTLGEAPDHIPREREQVFTAHTSEFPPALARAVSQGDALDAAALVEVLRAADPDPAVEALRLRALPAARSNDTSAVLAALGAPTHHAVRAFADISPLLTRDRAVAAPWLRLGMTHTPQATMSLWSRLQHINAIERALQGSLTVENDQTAGMHFSIGLFTDILSERRAMAGAHSMLMEAWSVAVVHDVWVTAVLMTLRDEAQLHRH